MKYYIIAGEKSGDLHGANLITALMEKDSHAEIRFWGGDDMEKVTDQKPVKHIKELAFMGFVAVLKNLRTILKNIDLCKKDILDFKPDCIVFIDYPGFNLRIAEFAKNNGFKTAYYIAPQLWAWKEKRIHKIKKYVDELMVILPFEEKYFNDRGVEAHFVGHPLCQSIAHHNFSDFDWQTDKIKVALLPGSRAQELQRMLPVFNQLKNDKYDFIVAGTSPNLLEDYSNYGLTKHRIVFDQTYELLRAADMAVVTSGTATLETALLNVPQIVVYKGSKLLYEVGKRIIKVPYIALVNLIAGKEVVKELIQDSCTSDSILKELSNIENNKQTILADYTQMVDKLSDGNASYKASSIIFALAKK